MNPKYGEKNKIMLQRYRQPYSLHKNIKKNIYWDISKDVETGFDTSNYKLVRPLPKENDGKVIGLMNDDLGGKTMT